MRHQSGCWITRKGKLADPGEIARRIVSKIQVVAAVYRFVNYTANWIKCGRDGTVDWSRPGQAGLCAARISIAHIYAAGIGDLSNQPGTSIVGEGALALVKG